MTLEQIAEGLSLLVMRLANAPITERPDGWAPHDWAYVKGVASGEILRLRDRLVPRDTLSERSEKSSQT
jgi:hypothetical protein